MESTPPEQGSHHLQVGGGRSGYNYHHILDLQQAQQGNELYNSNLEPENLAAAAINGLPGGMIVGGTSVALLADEVSRGSTQSAGTSRGRSLGRGKKMLFSVVALTTVGTGLMYMAPLATDLTAAPALPAESPMSEALKMFNLSWPLRGDEGFSVGPEYHQFMSTLTHEERRALLEADLKCWSVSPVYVATHHENGTRMTEAEMAVTKTTANSSAVEGPEFDAGERHKHKSHHKHFKPHVADPSNCLPAPYLYVTYHGGYEDFRVKNVCKYSRDGCNLGSVLLPDTKEFNKYWKTSTSTSTTGEIDMEANKTEHNHHHKNEKKKSEETEHKQNKKEQENGYSVHSLRGMMLTKGNLYVAEAWKENSLVLEYSSCLTEIGNRRALARILINHGNMQETETYNRTRDEIRGKPYIYEKPEQISALDDDSSSGTWKHLKMAVENALREGTGDDSHQEPPKKNIKSRHSKKSSHGGDATADYNGQSEAAPKRQTLDSEISEQWDHKQVNGLVHPYGFARAPHDPYLYVSSQDTFAVLRYDMETGQPGPMSKGALWYYALRKIEENRNKKDQQIDYAGDDRALDILRAEMLASTNLNRTVLRAINEDGRDELELARAYREVRKQRNDMYAGVMVDLMGNEIRGIVFDTEGRLYVADKQRAVRVFDSDGFEIKHTAAHVPSPISLALDKDRNSIWIGSSITHSLYEIDASTWRAKQIITSPVMEHPAGLQVWGESLFVVSQAQGKLLEFSVSKGELQNIVLDKLPDVGERVIMSPC